MKTVVIESGATQARDAIGYRYVCLACKVEGPWLPSLNQVERQAAAHNRERHAKAVQA